MGTAVTLAVLPLPHLPPEAFWFLTHEQALVFAGRTLPQPHPPPSLAGASAVRTGCSSLPASSLLPCQGYTPRPPLILPTPFLSPKWTKPVPVCQHHSLSHLWACLEATCSLPGHSFPILLCTLLSREAPAVVMTDLLPLGLSPKDLPFPSGWSIHHRLQFLLTGQDKVLHLGSDQQGSRGEGAGQRAPEG